MTTTHGGATGSPMDPAPFFAEPLVDLGARDRRFEGIHGTDGAQATTGLTAQFLENADAYHQRYFDTSYWELVLHPALDAMGESMRAPRAILDIGSGSGNSIFPLAKRFPDARIVAIDASPQLLAILRDYVRRRPDAQRFAMVCVDATRACYQPGVADLAVGAAILHHVYEPERVIASCLQALRPGGWAAFFEPFEAGTFLLYLCYQRILQEASAEERDTPAMKMLARLVHDYVVRSRPRSDPIFRELDDKWMFTRAWFERVGHEQGWAEVVVRPLHVFPDGLRRQAQVQLRLGAGLAADALPAWAWAVVDEADRGMSADLRHEMALEASILLRKPG